MEKQKESYPMKDLARKLKSGYSLSIGKTEYGEVTGVFIKGRDQISDLREVKDEELLFLTQLPILRDEVWNGKSLIAYYDENSDKYVAELRKQEPRVEYNKTAYWQTQVVSREDDILLSLIDLNNKAKREERGEEVCRRHY